MSAAKNLGQQLMMSAKKPKKKFANQEQKHHYLHAARHYHSYKRTFKDPETNEKHIKAIRQHMAAGKFTEFHRDQVQHDSRYSGPASGTEFTPYKKKRRGKLILKSRRVGVKK